MTLLNPLIILSLLLSGCLAKRAPYKPAVAPEPTIEIKGQLIDGSANGIDSADLFLESSNEEPIATSKSGGSFTTSVATSQIERASFSSSLTEPVWYVYSHRKGGTPLAGVSTAQRSNGLPRTVDLGKIPMLPVSSFSGIVYHYSNSGLAPLAGARVTLARSKSLTDEDGSFKLTDLPSAKMSLQIQSDGFETHSSTPDIKPGKDQVSTRNFVLLGQSLLEAVFIPKPWARNPNKASGSFERSFELYATKSSKFIRYHHDRSQFEIAPDLGATGATSPFQWRKISEEISYTFPQAGLNRLWYQVANEDKSVVSDLRESTVVLNPCEGLDRIVINNGEPTIKERQVTVTFSELPASAYRIKLAESIQALQSTNWRNVQRQVPFIFVNETSEADFGGQGAPVVSNQFGANFRQIFAQVETREGECPVLTSSVILQPFPPPTQPMLVLNGGLPVSESLILSASIPNLPQNAFEMRIAEIPGTGIANQLNLAPWMHVRSQMPMLVQSAGFRTIALQFRDSDGLTSPIYTANIQVIPPQDADFRVSFAQLNPLVPARPSRYVNLDLFPPSTAVSFRYLEASGSVVGGGGGFNPISELALQPWLNLTPRVPVYARGEGLRVFFVQYQLSANENATVTVRREIFIDVTPATVGGFLINGGAALTLYPFVKLYIAPPIDVASMTATDFNAGFGIDNWLQIAPTLDYRLNQQGPNTVMLRFRDNNANVTDPALLQTIFYDPFPPFPLGLKPLVINSDSPTTNAANVTLTITAPESARSYRISESPNFFDANQFTQIPTTPRINLPGASWEVTQFDAPFILSSTAGPKIVHVQFKNDTGLISSAILDSITLQP